MQDSTSQNQKKEKDEKQEENEKLNEKVNTEEQEAGKTIVKNANAAGQGAIGRTGEKPGPEMDGNMNY